MGGVILIQISSHWPYIRVQREQPLTQKAIGWAALITMILASSTYNVFAKPLLGALSPFSLLFLSELLTLLFALTSFGLIPIVQHLAGLSRGKILSLLWIGIMSGTIAPLLWFSGLQATSAVNANLFGNAEMVFLILLAVFVLGERWTKWHALAGCTISLGIAIVALRGFREGFMLFSGDTLILLGSLSFSCGSITFRKYLHHLPPELAIFVRSVVALSLLLVFFLQHSFFQEIRTFPPALLPALIGFGFIARFLNIFTFYGAIERLPVATVSLLASLTVVTGTLFAHFSLGEPIFWYHIAGGILIILGTVLLETVGMHPSEKHLADQLAQRQHRA